MATEARRRQVREYLESYLVNENRRRERLIQAGWDRVVSHGHFGDATPAQLAQLRLAYFGGARHMFFAIVGSFELPKRGHETGYEVFAAIENELDAFAAELPVHTHDRTN